MERAFLVAIEFDQRRADGLPGRGQTWPLADELQELEELAKSAGSRLVGHTLVRRHEPVAGTFIGTGKWDEIARSVEDAQAQVVILNQELSPSQQRNVEEMVRVKTIDRTQLILDIFAQRARSQEGKVQVELAQLGYLLPRLVGKGVLLSRLGGGIGTRGPGEQKLEVDRRRIRRRITKLNDELKKLAQRREATRQRRREAQVPVVALVGYTNAGKTTLLNRLTGALAPAENRPFTTLDPLAKRLRLPTGTWAILTDTVGFLHRLPHHLIEAFKATLEETRDAALLLHVLDASHPLALEQAEAVHDVLALLELHHKPLLTVLNKMDRLQDLPAHSIAAQAGPRPLAFLEQRLPNPVAVSALRGQGLDALLSAIERQLTLPAPLDGRLPGPAPSSALP